jgi:hypothetical protein
MSREGENLPVIVIGVLAAAAACVGLVMWGSARASKAAPSSPGVPRPEPVGMFPDLKVGDTVVVDTAAANVPADVPTIVAIVDLVLVDPTLVSVQAVGVSFRGTIPRVSILRVLPPPPPGVFA